MRLVYGTRYRATIALGWLEGMASNGAVESKLEEAGFMGVAVTGSGRSRVATGTWAQPTQEADLPDQVRGVEVLP